MAVPDAIAQILDPLSVDRLLKLQQLVQQRTVVPYVGAGMSVCAGLPTWSQFCEAVALQAPASGRERVPQNWPFAKMLERYAESGWLTDFIANQFDRDFTGIDLRRAPIALLRSIRPPFVVTTNYDRLLEHVLAGSVGDVFTGSEIDPRVYWNVLRVSDSDKTFILKLHGSSDLENGLVATHRQYQEAYHRPGKLRQLLLHLMGARSLLFLGCGLSADDDPVKILAFLKAKLGAFAQRHYAIRSRPADDGEVRKEEKRLAKLSVKPIWYHDSHDKGLRVILEFLSGELRAGYTTSAPKDLSEPFPILEWVLSTVTDTPVLSRDSWLSFKRRVEVCALQMDLTVQAKPGQGTLEFNCREGDLFEHGRKSATLALSSLPLPVTYRLPTRLFLKEAVKVLDISHASRGNALRVCWNDQVLAELPIDCTYEALTRAQAV